MSVKVTDDIIAKYQDNNLMLSEAMLNGFSEKIDSILNSAITISIEETITRHLENFLDPLSSVKVASSITDSFRSDVNDLIEEAKSDATALVRQYTSHLAVQIVKAIQNYDQQTCGCVNCHTKPAKEKRNGTN